MAGIVTSSGDISFDYYSDALSRTSYAPTVVSCFPDTGTAIFRGGKLEITSPDDAYFSFAPQPRNRRCKCKGGLKYKNCHGRSESKYYELNNEKVKVNVIPSNDSPN